MKVMSAILFLLSFATFAQDSTFQFTKVDTGVVVPKNSISVGRNHSTVGLSYSRNYYPYAAASIFVGTHRKDEEGISSEIQSLGIGLDWTAEDSTLKTGLYLRPAVVLYRVNGQDKGYYKIGTTRLYDGDNSIALSVTPYYKFTGKLFDQALFINSGIEFIRMRSENIARFMVMAGTSF